MEFYMRHAKEYSMLFALLLSPSACHSGKSKTDHSPSVEGSPISNLDQAIEKEVEQEPENKAEQEPAKDPKPEPTAEEKSDFPATFLETGLFINGDISTPAAGVQKYEVKVPFWSDGAKKEHYLRLPPGTSLSYNEATGAFQFPTGTVLIKHFVTDGNPSRNIETRVILRKESSWAYGVYIWNDDGSVTLSKKTRVIQKEAKDYRVPSVGECVMCHRAGQEVLGFVPPQLNFSQENGQNQIETLIKNQQLLGDLTQLTAIKALDNVNDASLTIDTRTRTYMQVNCSVCHNPDGPGGANLMDMRLIATDTKLVSREKIVPGKPDESILWMKVSGDTSRMPPVSIRPDPLALEIIRLYIERMPIPGSPPPQ